MRSARSAPKAGETSQVKTTLETISPTKVKLVIEVPGAEFAPTLRAAYAQAAKDIEVPGFRHGKVPPRLLDQRAGRGAIVEYAIHGVIDEWFQKAAREHELHPLAPPEADVVTQPDSLDVTQSVVVQFELEVRPKVEFPELTQVTVTVPAIDVTEAAIDEQVELLRRRFASLVKVDRPARDGDFVSIDLRATRDGEEVDAVAGMSYQVGAGTMIDGLDEALTGLSAGEPTTFESELAGEQDAAGPALVEVTIRSVKEQELPPVDDEFAQMASEFDTVAELRDGLAKVEEREQHLGQYAAAGRKLLEVLADAVDMPVPEGLAATMLTRRLAAEPHADSSRRAEIEAEIAHDLRIRMVNDALSQTLKTQVHQADVVDYLLTQAQRAGMDPSEFVERAEATGSIHGYVIDIARSKARVEALTQVVLVDEAGQAVDLSEFLYPPEEEDDGEDFDDYEDDEDFDEEEDFDDNGDFVEDEDNRPQG
jgi:trigger factor